MKMALIAIFGLPQAFLSCSEKDVFLSVLKVCEMCKWGCG